MRAAPRRVRRGPGRGALHGLLRGLRDVGGEIRRQRPANDGLAVHRIAGHGRYQQRAVRHRQRRVDRRQDGQQVEPRRRIDRGAIGIARAAGRHRAKQRRLRLRPDGRLDRWQGLRLHGLDARRVREGSHGSAIRARGLLPRRGAAPRRTCPMPSPSAGGSTHAFAGATAASVRRIPSAYGVLRTGPIRRCSAASSRITGSVSR